MNDGPTRSHWAGSDVVFSGFELLSALDEGEYRQGSYAGDQEAQTPVLDKTNNGGKPLCRVSTMEVDELTEEQPLEEKGCAK
jgi:hypothetical protein